MVVVIPARNEEATIGALVREVGQQGNVIVIDDCSDDRTAADARDAGAHVVINVMRRHIAYSTIRGMHVALSTGASKIVTMDAGGSHYPYELWGLLGPDADLVIGSRRRYHAPWRRRLLSWLGSECANLAMQTNLGRVHDCTSGFRCYSRRAVELLCDANIVSYSYDFQIEALARIHAAGMMIAEVPVSYRFTNSHLRACDVWRALKMCKKIHGGKL